MRCRYARRTGVKSERWKVTLYFGGKKWVRYSYDDRVPLSSEFLAQRLCHAINAEIERLGVGFSPKAWFKPSTHELRLENYARDWLERRSRDIAPATYTSFKGILGKYVIPVLGHLDIRSIKKGNLDDYLLKLPEDFSQKTKEVHISLIRSILRSAFKREDLQRVPPFPSVKVQTPEIRWLDYEQQEAVFGAIPEEHQPIFRVLGFYGMRPGEARALMWDCVDWSNKTITVKRTFSGPILREATKNSDIRYLPILPQIEEILRSIRGLGGFVFRTRRGDPYSHVLLTRTWAKATKKAKIPFVRLYQGLRHSSAMQKFLDGWDMENIRELFGHRDLRMTRRYAKANVETLRSRFECVPTRPPGRKEDPEGSH